jgi:hypothetical protein
MPGPPNVTCPTCGAVAVPAEPGSFVAFPKGHAPERTPGTDLAWCDACESPFEVPAS